MTENSFNGCFKAAAAHLGFGTMSRKQSNKPVRANRRALAVRTLSSYPELRRLGIGPAKGVRTVVIERSGAVAQGSAAQNGHAQVLPSCRMSLRCVLNMHCFSSSAGAPRTEASSARLEPCEGKLSRTVLRGGVSG